MSETRKRQRDAERKRTRRGVETLEERDTRLQSQRQRQLQRRHNETEEEHETRLQSQRQRRHNETEEERETRLQSQRQRRHNETEEEHEARLNYQRTYRRNLSENLIDEDELHLDLNPVVEDGLHSHEIPILPLENIPIFPSDNHFYGSNVYEYHQELDILPLSILLQNADNILEDIEAGLLPLSPPFHQTPVQLHNPLHNPMRLTSGSPFDFFPHVIQRLESPSPHITPNNSPIPSQNPIPSNDAIFQGEGLDFDDFEIDSIHDANEAQSSQLGYDEAHEIANQQVPVEAPVINAPQIQLDVPQRNLRNLKNIARIKIDDFIEREFYQHHYSNLGNLLTHACPHCKARYSSAEINTSGKFMLCCQNGKVMLPRISKPLDYVSDLLLKRRPHGRDFYSSSRAINTQCSFSSIRLHQDPNLPFGRGLPALRIQGAICHRVGPIIPAPFQEPSFIQALFYDGYCRNGL